MMNLTKWFGVVFYLNQVSSLTESTGVNKQPKIILYWNTFYNQTDMTFGFGQQPFLKSGCENSNCIATNDRRLFNQSDGILIHAGDCSEDDLPTHRFPNQTFIFLNHQPLIEPAGGSHRSCFSRPHFYNWTMTHRRDSDVHLGLPFGKVRRRKDAINNRIPYQLSCRQSSSRSKLLITWFDSSCSTQSQREIYFKKLAEFVPVDVYGKCGRLWCFPENDPRCQLRVIGHYKFYFAAEDFLCPDYVTEHFYRALMNDIVPVVYGGADYTQYAPPNSYVNVADFATIKELADYLLLLDKNEALYSKYFDWKRDYEVIPQTTDGWCDLCKKLNDQEQEKKSYENLTKWWYDDVPCLLGSSYLSSVLSNTPSSYNTPKI